MASICNEVENYQMYPQFRLVNRSIYYLLWGLAVRITKYLLLLTSNKSSIYRQLLA